MVLLNLIEFSQLVREYCVKIPWLGFKELWSIFPKLYFEIFDAFYANKVITQIELRIKIFFMNPSILYSLTG